MANYSNTNTFSASAPKQPQFNQLVTDQVLSYLINNELGHSLEVTKTGSIVLVKLLSKSGNVLSSINFDTYVSQPIESMTFNTNTKLLDTKMYDGTHIYCSLHALYDYADLKVAAEASIRQVADTNLQENINDEADARLAAITAEATARQAADTAEATTRAAKDTELEGVIATKASQVSVDEINAKIPTEASSDNKLADKSYVNTQIESVAAYYVTSNVAGDAFQTHAALVAGPWYYAGEPRVLTRNDYAVVLTDESQKITAGQYTSFTSTTDYIGYHVSYNSNYVLVTQENKDTLGITPGVTVAYLLPTTRYTYTKPDGATTGSWTFQYIISSAPLTEAQIAAINSGITSQRVVNLDANTAARHTHSNKAELDLVASGDVAKWNAKYDKPADGIPKTDLTSSVQTSLGKADTAIQDVSDKEDKSNKVTSWSQTTTNTNYPSEKLVKDSLDNKSKVVANPETTTLELSGVTIDGTSYKIKGMPDGTSAGDALVWNGSQWAIQDDYGYTEGNSLRQTTITWNGQIGERESHFDGMFVKMQSEFPSDFETSFIGKSFTLNDSSVNVIDTIVPDQDYPDLVSCCAAEAELAVVVIKNDIEFYGDQITAGLYFMKMEDAYISSFTYGSAATVHQFDIKYIPHDATKADLTRVETIEGKIPNQATALNQLADKNFVNSSINSVTAYYITKNASGDQFATKAELDSTTTFYSGGVVRVPTRNDYCIVVSDETHSNATTRYIYHNAWEFQYKVNDTPFTAAQLAAINSGVTASKVADLDLNTTARHTHSNKQVLDGIASTDISSWNSAKSWVDTNGTNVTSHLTNATIHITAAERGAWNSKYSKPSTGIPKTDLASDVQTSLGKADTAVQDISGKEDVSNKVTTITSSSTDTLYPSAKAVYDKFNDMEVYTAAEIDALWESIT